MTAQLKRDHKQAGFGVDFPGFKSQQVSHSNRRYVLPSICASSDAVHRRHFTKKSSSESFSTTFYAELFW